MDDGVGTDRRCALGIAMSDTSPDDMMDIDSPPKKETAADDAALVQRTARLRRPTQ